MKSSRFPTCNGTGQLHAVPMPMPMARIHLSRRQVTGALVAVFGFAFAGAHACVFAGEVPTNACVPIGAFSTDVTPMVAQGLGGYADTIAQAMDEALSEVLPSATRNGAGHKPHPGKANAARLIVRLDGVSMPSYVPGARHGRGGAGSEEKDELEGVGYLYQAGSNTPKSHPILAVLGADSGGAWYDPKSEERRLKALCFHFAWWLNRALQTDLCSGAQG